ncbi:MAG TPA: hypothetical protein VHY08_01810 [Bacillota bacterium]|nr:hypothetical protein [Bacillota bacterium]
MAKGTAKKRQEGFFGGKCGWPETNGVMGSEFINANTRSVSNEIQMTRELFVKEEPDQSKKLIVTITGRLVKPDKLTLKCNSGNFELITDGATREIQIAPDKKPGKNQMGYSGVKVRYYPSTQCIKFSAGFIWRATNWVDDQPDGEKYPLRGMILVRWEPL